MVDVTSDAECACMYFRMKGVAANMSLLYFIKSIIIYLSFIWTACHGKRIKFFKGNNLTLVTTVNIVYAGP